MKKTLMLSLEITEELRQAVRKFAYEKDLTISAAIRYILKDYLRIEENEPNIKK